jgi:hypothetical protein
MGKVAEWPQMSVNPGPATASDWKHVAYKDGAEPGALYRTTQVTAFNGTTYCVAATWNNPMHAVDHARFQMLYVNMLNSLR